MKRCLKECSSEEYMCHNKMGGLLCTRERSHKGNHHAHGPGQDCLRTWTQTEAVVEAL